MPKPSDKWIPWYFVAFFVGLAIVNAVFVYLATSTNTGVITKQAYEKGLEYNQVIAASREADALGWQAYITLEDGKLQTQVKNDRRQPVEHAQVVAYFTRPTTEGHDFEHQLHEAAPGLYAGEIHAPLKGQWDVRIAVTWQNQHYQKSQRIVIR